MLLAIILSVIILNVSKPSAIRLSVLVRVLMFCAIILCVIKLNVFKPSTIRLSVLTESFYVVCHYTVCY